MSLKIGVEGHEEAEAAGWAGLLSSDSWTFHPCGSFRITGEKGVSFGVKRLRGTVALHSCFKI